MKEIFEQFPKNLDESPALQVWRKLGPIDTDKLAKQNGFKLKEISLIQFEGII